MASTTPVISVVFFLIASVLGAVGQYLYKSGSDSATGGLSSYLLNPKLLGGVVCYVGVMILFVAAFKKGGAMSVLYPIYASTFIWAAIISMIVFGTAIKPSNMLGMCLLVGGMYLMGK